MKKYRLIYDSRRLLTEKEKLIPKIFTLEEIDINIFSASIIKKMESARDSTVITVRDSTIHANSFVGISVIDLEQRKEIKNKYKKLNKELSKLEDNPTIQRYLYLKNKVENYW